MFWDDEQLPEVPADILDQLEGRGFDMGGDDREFGKNRTTRASPLSASAIAI